MAPPKKYKLAIIVSHVIQYAVPLYKEINAHPDIDLTVFFCSDYGLVPYNDRKFKVELQWDSLDLESFKYKVLKNYSPFPDVNYFIGLINPGIIRELKEEKYDAIIINGYALASYWLAIYAALVTKTPYFLTGESPTPWKAKIRAFITGVMKRIFMPLLIAKASGILYIGQKAKAYYLKFAKGAEDRLFFAPYSVDNDFFFEKARQLKDKKKELKKELGLPEDYPVILYLSKLIKWKRPIFLLQVLRKLKTPVSVVFVGSGQRLKVLKKYKQIHNLNQAFLFGFQNYSQVPKFYALADIFVLPSLGESWGLVLNEAMCFGLPIVTTDQVNSAHDLVFDGQNGYVLHKNDLMGFVKNLDYLLSNPRERERMGNVSAGIIRNWSYDNYVSGLLCALRRVKP